MNCLDNNPECSEAGLLWHNIMIQPHIKLKEDVVVGVLVGEGDGALFFQMDGVNQ